MIVQWKASNIKSDFVDSKYSLRGDLVAVTDKKREHVIPYGAIDAKVERAEAKAFSELFERAVWFVLYDLAPTMFPRTYGFSAHLDWEAAVLNSKEEYYERYIFDLLVKAMGESNGSYIEKNFEVVVKDSQTSFVTYVNACNSYIAYTFVFHEVGLEIGVTYGMGKDSDRSVAVEESYDESTLLKNALTSFLNRKQRSGAGQVDMTRGEFIKVEKMFRDENIAGFLKRIKPSTLTPLCYKDFLPKVCSVDVTDFRPDFLKSIKRIAAWSGDCEIAKSLMEMASAYRQGRRQL